MWATSFDQSVCERFQRLRYGYPDLLCSFHVDDNLEHRRLLDGKVSRLCASEDLRDVTACIARQLTQAWTVTNEAARLSVGSASANGRQPRFCRQCGDHRAVGAERSVGKYIESQPTFIRDSSENTLDGRRVIGFEHFEPDAQALGRNFGLSNHLGLEDALIGVPDHGQTLEAGSHLRSEERRVGKSVDL